jgi:hypothetical protein
MYKYTAKHWEGNCNEKIACAADYIDSPDFPGGMRRRPEFGEKG